VAKFLSAPDETTGRRYASAMAGRYAVIDGATAVGKFHAVLTYAGKNQNQYFEQFLVRNKNEVTQVLLYYPAYYRTMTARLYNFDGREVPATRAVAVGYAERTDGTVAYKEITSSQLFTSYEDAAAWVAVQKSGKFVIASDNPFLSPVAQPALTAFKLVHGSPLSISIGDKTTPSVKVFQYLPAP
jgi:dolichyl-diphosphooligosaccharide--protein glycosyltransferase